MSRRQILLAVAAVLGGLALLVIAFLASVVLSMPAGQGKRIDGGDVVGIDTGSSYAWVVPTASGVVLVDAGGAADAAALKAEIGDRRVQAVLITHGHVDHTTGLAAFPGVPVWCGPGEAAMIRGTSLPRGWAQRVLINHVLAGPPPPADLREAADGEALAVDGETFTVVHVPGHTPGSAMYLWKDLLFSAIQRSATGTTSRRCTGCSPTTTR
jgi:hydroxyacylglutathione hydrolase